MPVSIRFVSGKVATSGVYKSTISMNSSKHTERVVNTMTSQEAYKNATMNSENCGENCQSWWTMIRCHKRKEYSCVSADIALRFSNELTLNLGNKQAKELALQKRRDSLSRKEYVLRQKITRDILMRADVASIIVAFSPFVRANPQTCQDLHNVYLICVTRTKRDRLPSCFPGRGDDVDRARIVNSIDERGASVNFLVERIPI